MLAHCGLEHEYKIPLHFLDESCVSEKEWKISFLFLTLPQVVDLSYLILSEESGRKPKLVLYGADQIRIIHVTLA